MQMMTESRRLLADYAKNRTESSFQDLVSHYLGLVHSTAIRIVNGDSQLAEDVSQIVFADLARMANTLSDEVMLGGWLHRHTCFVASKIMRTERARKLREQQSLDMNRNEDHSVEILEEIAPVLDEAVNQLGSQDRKAILLRYFEQLDLRSIGQILGSNEDAAQKRVSRALEKLRVLLKKRGSQISTVTIAAILTSNAVSAVPAGLATSISASVLAGEAVTSGLTLTFLKIMTLTKIKVGILTVIATATIATPVIVQQHQTIAHLQRENVVLSEKVTKATEANDEKMKVDQQLAQTRQIAASQPKLAESQQNELLRLRNEVGLLREEKKKNEQLKATLAQSQAKLAQVNSQETQKDIQIQKNTCINNLRVIDGAMQQWALENNKRPEEIPQVTDILPYFPNQKFPECPTGGHYLIGRIDQAPKCNIPGHELPQNPPANVSDSKE